MRTYIEKEHGYWEGAKQVENILEDDPQDVGGVERENKSFAKESTHFPQLLLFRLHLVQIVVDSHVLDDVTALPLDKLEMCYATEQTTYYSCSSVS